MLTWCIRLTRAHVVLPEGRKANWSIRDSSGMLGLIKRLTLSLSSTQDAMEVTEIGLKSLIDSGLAVFWFLVFIKSFSTAV